jgi:hypothetical protein
MKYMMLKPNRLGLKPLSCSLIIIILFFGTIASPAAAKVAGWEVIPDNPKIGDTLIISGLASPEEEVEVSVSFKKTVPVYLREYTYEFENIEILNFNNLFTVRAEGVESLKVKMKMVLSKTENAWAEDGIATVTYSGVSPGEYRVRVDGMAENGASGVNLIVTTVQKLNAGKDGKFSYRYNTESVPSGKLEIKLGDSEREIIFEGEGKAPVLQATTAPSHVQASGEAEERKTSERMVTGRGSVDTELTDRENEEKHSIYLTESSWDEDTTMAVTAGEVPSKESVEEQENQEPENQEQKIQEQEIQVINFYYVLAGILAGFGVLLAVRRKK